MIKKVFQFIGKWTYKAFEFIHNPGKVIIDDIEPEGYKNDDRSDQK